MIPTSRLGLGCLASIFPNTDLSCKVAYELQAFPVMQNCSDFCDRLDAVTGRSHSDGHRYCSQVLGGLPEDTPEAPEIPLVQGHELLGGPQMIQLRYGAYP